jgi:hypothetical protein
MKVIEMRRGSLRGFEGEITRVVKVKGSRREYFIKGKEDTTFEEAIRQSWPVEDHKVNSKWRVVSSSGEDLTKRKLSSYDKTVIIEFI